MPYEWVTPAGSVEVEQELHLWPHQSLPPKGQVAFIGATFALILLPLMPLLGSSLLWALLPFLMLAVAGLWWALARSRRDAQVLEILRLTTTDAHLQRHVPGQPAMEWSCNRYWVTPKLHRKGGPVPDYVTLRGGDREVEIGAFLAETERRALFDELCRVFGRNS